MPRHCLGYGLLLLFFLSAPKTLLSGDPVFAPTNRLCCKGVVKDNVKYGYQEWNPRFIGPKSEYMGEPRPALDQRWYHLSKSRPIRPTMCPQIPSLTCTVYTYAVDHQAIVDMNRTKGTVQYPGTHSYVAGLEAFHQLHCLVRYVKFSGGPSTKDDLDRIMSECTHIKTTMRRLIMICSLSPRRNGRTIKVRMIQISSLTIFTR